MSDYSKLTKKELIYTLYARDMMLKDCRDRFQAHKETDCRTIQEQSDLIEILKTKLDEKQNELVEKTTQLAQQLEKLKSENHALVSDNAYQEADMFEFNSRIEQLQKQLAESERERHEEWKTGKEWKWAWQKEHNGKISFCIEQLEKVKEDILLDISIGIQRDWISNKIDNQIEQLKEMK